MYPEQFLFWRRIMRAVFYNGLFTDFEKLGIPLTDRAVFFGDGVYDVCLGYGGGLYLFNEHIERFYGNIERIGLIPYCEREKLCEISKKLIELSGENEYVFYMQASGYSERREHARTDGRSNLLLAVFPAKNPVCDPIRLRTVADLRGNTCDIKSINLLPAVLASSEGEKLSYDESIYVRKDTVTECAHSSLMIVKSGTVYTHPLTSAILPGITRQRSLEILRKLGVNCVEEPFGIKELYSADEVLVLSTTKFCRRAKEVDGVRYPNAHSEISEILTKNLLKDYAKNTFF
jgi:D-alanine transaminase